VGAHDVVEGKAFPWVFNASCNTVCNAPRLQWK